jgi:hypothetical protein
MLKPHYLTAVGVRHTDNEFDNDALSYAKQKKYSISTYKVLTAHW